MALPVGYFIISGDFNHANLRTVAPKFYQHANFATRGDNILDLFYTYLCDSHKATPHLGFSDHLCVLLLNAYKPLLKRSRPAQKTIPVCPEEAITELQDSF